MYRTLAAAVFVLLPQQLSINRLQQHNNFISHYATPLNLYAIRFYFFAYFADSSFAFLYYMPYITGWKKWKFCVISTRASALVKYIFFTSSQASCARISISMSVLPVVLLVFRAASFYWLSRLSLVCRVVFMSCKRNTNTKKKQQKIM